eukprot:2490823-Prymnesium_polylepis.1
MLCPGPCVPRALWDMASDCRRSTARPHRGHIGRRRHARLLLHRLLGSRPRKVHRTSARHWLRCVR